MDWVWWFREGGPLPILRFKEMSSTVLPHSVRPRGQFQGGITMPSSMGFRG